MLDDEILFTENPTQCEIPEGHMLGLILNKRVVFIRKGRSSFFWFYYILPAVLLEEDGCQGYGGD